MELVYDHVVTYLLPSGALWVTASSPDAFCSNQACLLGILPATPSCSVQRLWPLQLWSRFLLWTLQQCALPSPSQHIKWAGQSSTQKLRWTSQHRNENKSPGTFLRQTEDLEEQYLAELKAPPPRLRQQLEADTKIFKTHFRLILPPKGFPSSQLQTRYLEMEFERCVVDKQVLLYLKVDALFMLVWSSVRLWQVSSTAHPYSRFLPGPQLCHILLSCCCPQALRIQLSPATSLRKSIYRHLPFGKSESRL